MTQYAVFSHVKDQVSNDTVPVGLIAWAPELGWHKTRFIKPGEAITGLRAEQYVPFIRLVQDKLEHWEEPGRLPYSEEKSRPHDDGWWAHVQKPLNHEIRLSEPKPFECRDARKSLEPLYLSVSAPHRLVREQQKRLQRAVKECLRDVYYRLYPVAFRGAGGVDVNFWRGCHVSDQTVAINCLNLATRQARFRCDALLGQLSRLDEGQTQNLRVLLGYLPPAEESSEATGVLRLLCERHHRVQAFDLLRQPDEFRQTAEELVGGKR